MKERRQELTRGRSKGGKKKTKGENGGMKKESRDQKSRKEGKKSQG